MGKTIVLGASYYFYKATQFYKKISGFRVGNNKGCGLLDCYSMWLLKFRKNVCYKDGSSSFLRNVGRPLRNFTLS